MTFLLYFIFNLIGIQVNSAFKIYLGSYPFSPSPLPKPWSTLARIIASFLLLSLCCCPHILKLAVRMVHLKYKSYHVIPLLRTFQCFSSHTGQKSSYGLYGPTRPAIPLRPSHYLYDPPPPLLSPLSSVLQPPWPLTSAWILLRCSHLRMLSVWSTLPPGSYAATCSLL